jgi:LPS-assembly protein
MKGIRRLAQITNASRHWCARFMGGFLIVLFSATLCLSVQTQEGKELQVRTEIPYRDGIVVLLSDSQRKLSKTRYRAEGHVRITYKDIVMTGEEAEYDEKTGEGFLKGQTRFTRKEEWLICSKAEFDFKNQTGIFYDASGHTDEQFSIQSAIIRKTGPETYKFEDGIATTCPDKVPKWSFKASSANIKVDGTARMHKAFFKIKGFPVLYSPYVVYPMEKKTRSSGFVPFHTGNSTSKGRVFSEGYYQTLGRSADLFVYGDYFSQRGLAIGSIFKIRPNPVTKFTLDVYGIDDKLDQSGVRLIVDGESLLKDDWRAVARVNITSNFSFRQAFEDSFRGATVSQERATAFLTRNHKSISTNIAFAREEVFFPDHPLVIRKIPSLELMSLGIPLGNSPFIFDFRTSLNSMSRMDAEIETQHMIQRLDVYPRLTWRLPSLAGFSLIPSVGARETYYGAQLSEDSSTGKPLVVNQALHRRYADLNIELRTPVLERDFASTWFGSFRHAIEPFITYRWIHGINDLHKTIRFDEEDAIAESNEVEYGIVNRFFKSRPINQNARETIEFMSFGLVQKYYFDPTFGGAFREGESNAFYPLDSVTGFYQTGEISNFAPVSMVFQLTPKSGIHSDFRADFDVKHQRWRNEGLSTLWQQGKFFLSGTYYRIHALEALSPASHHIQGQISYGSFKKGLSSSLTMSYNLQTGQLLNSNTRVNYTWDCCGVGAEFNQYDLGQRIESKFTFSFTLKGIGSFGNMKRPDSLF